MPFTVLMTAPTLAPAGRDVLDQAGCRTLFAAGGVPDMERLLATEPVDAVISRTLSISAEAMASCRTLRVISRHGVGLNNVDLLAATRLGIPILVARGANARSVAELAVGLMLAVARDIAVHNAAVRAGCPWDRSRIGMQLSGRRLGLVGLGAIGRLVARTARALGMSVAAFDPAAAPEPGVEPFQSLDALLARSDVLSLHVPLTPATRRLIGARELGLLPPGAMLVNTARGELIDEPALAQALIRGHLAGAGLDTLDKEPPAPDNPLLGIASVVLTPHIGATTREATAAVAAMAAANALAVLRGEPVDPSLCANPETLLPR